MTVNTQFTSAQRISLIALLVVGMFPFAVAPLAGSLDGFFLGLPIWFWMCFIIAIIMYGLVAVFIRDIGDVAASQAERTSEVN